MKPSEPQATGRIDRRTAIRWMMTVAASSTFIAQFAIPASAEQLVPGKVATGYGSDPDLLRTYKAGDLWPLTLSEAERATAAVLCDLIIPADEKGPKASSVGVPDFIDEWISAPYAGHSRDRTTIVEGLAWMNTESNRRFGDDFIKVNEKQQAAICDDICDRVKAPREWSQAAQFFARFRFLSASGYYTTPEGMRDIGYVGNIPSATFEGPPREVLQKLGLA